MEPSETRKKFAFRNDREVLIEILTIIKARSRRMEIMEDMIFEIHAKINATAAIPNQTKPEFKGPIPPLPVYTDPL